MRQPECITGRRRSRRPLIPCVILLLSTVGCGYSTGETMFALGLFKRPTVNAKFKLTEGPVAVIVDDFQDHCDWSEVPAELENKLVDELSKHRAALRLVAPAKVRRLRQSYAEFDARGFRELGKMLDAAQVVAVTVRSFRASPQAEEIGAAAQMGVSIKVIDSGGSDDDAQSRLWPANPDGELVVGELSVSELNSAKTRREIVSELARTVADKIARNFYDRQMEDFEREG